MPLVNILTQSLQPLPCRLGKPQTAKGIPKLYKTKSSIYIQDTIVEENKKDTVL